MNVIQELRTQCRSDMAARVFLENLLQELSLSRDDEGFRFLALDKIPSMGTPASLRTYVLSTLVQRGFVEQRFAVQVPEVHFEHHYSRQADVPESVPGVDGVPVKLTEDHVQPEYRATADLQA